MSKELKYCPHCGSTDLSHYEDNVTLAIFCSRCGLRSPLVIKSDNPDPKSETEFRWNTLPRKIKWTKKKPTENGFYYWRNKEADGNALTVAVVRMSDRTARFIGCDPFCCLDGIGGEWAGPIPEPEE